MKKNITHRKHKINVRNKTIIGLRQMNILENSKTDIEKLEQDRNIKELLNAFVEGDHDVSWKAAQALGRIKDEKSVEPLIKLLTHEDSDLR